MLLDKITIQLKRLFGKHKETLEQLIYIFLSTKSTFKQETDTGKTSRLVSGKESDIHEDVQMLHTT